MSTTAQQRERNPRQALLPIPPQHGAWAFLAVPLAMGFLTAGWSAIGLLFATAWFVAYPSSYYGGRALVIRRRRGSWTARARREAAKARWWVVLLLAVGLPLAALRPWLVFAGAGLVAAWGISLALTAAGRERGLVNDGLLVLQATAGLPLLAAVTTQTVPNPEVWWGALVCVTFFTGSVLHVKSHIRGAGDQRWAVASRAFNAGSLLLGVVSPWLLLPFGAATVRAFAVPAGARPALLGGVEAAVSALLVIGWAAALSDLAL